MKPYCIYAPSFRITSAGVIVMHRLAHELRNRGLEVYINTNIQNPAYPPLPVIGTFPPKNNQITDKFIAVYPEIIRGNPFGCRTVVRYILNVPGRYCHGPKSFAKSDILFVYGEEWNKLAKLGLPPERILFIPSIDLNEFYDMHVPRKGKLYFHGKNKKAYHPITETALPLGGRTAFVSFESRKMLRERLNECELLYSYDNATAMIDIARLCGCPVMLIPDPSYPKVMPSTISAAGLCYVGDMPESLLMKSDMNKVRNGYIQAEKIMQDRLDGFIKVTKEN